MTDELKIVICNGNELQQSIRKLKFFLQTNNIEVVPISEIYLKDKRYIELLYCTIYDAKHLSGTGHGYIIDYC
jgi:hypothetical protein